MTSAAQPVTGAQIRKKHTQPEIHAKKDNKCRKEEKQQQTLSQEVWHRYPAKTAKQPGKPIYLVSQRLKQAPSPRLGKSSVAEPASGMQSANGAITVWKTWVSLFGDPLGQLGGDDKELDTRKSCVSSLQLGVSSRTGPQLVLKDHCQYCKNWLPKKHRKLPNHGAKARVRLALDAAVKGCPAQCVLDRPGILLLWGLRSHQPENHVPAFEGGIEMPGC